MTTATLTPKQQERNQNRAKRAVKQLLRLQAVTKKAYKKMDDLLQTCIDTMQVGEVITLDDGRQVCLQDNFAKGNTAFKAAAHKRYDLKEVGNEANGRSRSNGDQS